MVHLPPLITDLGLILITAALSTLLFKKLGQPQVLGYLLAGLLVSQHVPFLPTIKDKESIQVWSEIGVIFLLFGLGLEFSFKKLLKVGGSATFTAVFEIIFMILLGYLLARILGWDNINSLFLGGILSISSTTIIVKAFHELGFRNQKYVEFVFGVLIVEDIFAILILVLFTAIGSSGDFFVKDLAESILRLLFYITLWFVIGIFIIPIFFRLVRPLLEDENMLLVALALCFFMVVIADSVGFSPPLGAFVMGSLLAETPEGKQIETLIGPVRNLFAALFFVSVGMMIDPTFFLDQWQLIVLVTIVTILGKLIGTFWGAILSGQHRKRSIQSGMSLGQIGEFSFIIASLGTNLKIISNIIYPLAIAVSTATTFTTPYLIKMSEAASHLIDKFIPTKIKLTMDRYHSSLKPDNKHNIFKLMVSTYGIKTFLNGTLIIAILSAFKTVLTEEIAEHLFNNAWTGTISLVVCLLLCAPFFWGLIMSGPTLGNQRQLDDLQRLGRVQFGLFIGRLLLGIILLSIIVTQFLSLKIAWSAIVLITIIAIFTSKYWIRFIYQTIEKNFFRNLSEKERKEIVSSKFAKNLLPWEASLGTYTLYSDSELVGKSLASLSFKEKHGLTVAAVYRGSRSLFAPEGKFVLWPYDEILCFGDEESLQRFHLFLEDEKSKYQNKDKTKLHHTEYQLSSFKVTPDSTYKNKSIRESEIRKLLKSMVVGVERGTQKILGPPSNFILNENDLVWLVKSRAVQKSAKETSSIE
ncbi:MAG: cation:proton antiporter domain-containing protein [Pseudobdellovibrionaceae bacterium]